MLRKYPIGIQSFREIREGGYVYIDKTQIIHTLAETGKFYFLSRPRRFGKSLLVDTIEELFSGSKDLFEGLWIYDKWDWTHTNPVIHLDFAELPYKEKGLKEAITYGLEINAKKHGVTLTGDSIKVQFRELIIKLSAKGQVIILIDEYDKPIIDFLEEPERLDTNQSIMKDFYSVLKARDKQIRLLLITGVSQFSKVSLFSDFNNLRNITLVSKFAAIAGITQEELEQNFFEEIADMQKDNPDVLSQIKQWYNGYTWNMKTWVYNPFSLLNFMNEPVFRNYWFETGTPTFLYRLLKKESVYDVESFRLNENSLSSFNTEHPNIGSLLFQTGYLTIKNISVTGPASEQLYELGLPNREVKASLLDGLLSIYRGKEQYDNLGYIRDLQASFSEGDVDGIINHINATITSIPYDYWKANSEYLFTVITYLLFKKVGMDVYTEMHSAKGRCDVLVRTVRFIYVLELKLDGSAAEALEQIKEKGYLKPYLNDTRKKIAVGMSFSSKAREVADYVVEEQ